MGVKAYVFGPDGWIVLESLAELYDRTPFSNALYRIMKQIFILFAKMIPCIYCRISFRGFTDPRKAWPAGDGITRPKEANVDEMLLKRKAKFLVYVLHNGVQDKLHTQEIMDQPKNKRKIDAKWKKKRITYQHALEKKFHKVETEKFWNSLIRFLGFVFCDYRADECSSYYNFFKIIGTYLKTAKESQLGNRYLESLAMTAPIWEKGMEFDTRLDIVWCIYKRMYDHLNIEYAYTRQEFKDLCINATVGNCVH